MPLVDWCTHTQELLPSSSLCVCVCLVRQDLRMFSYECVYDEYMNMNMLDQRDNYELTNTFVCIWTRTKKK